MSERWQKIDKLVEAALELKASDRKAFLEKACINDEDLQKEVESLIAANERAEQNGFLDEPPVKFFNKLIKAEPSQNTNFNNILFSLFKENIAKYKLKQQRSVAWIYGIAGFTTILILLILISFKYIETNNNKNNDVGLVIENNSKSQQIVKPHSLGYWGMLQRYNKTQKPIGNPIRLSSITGQTYANKGDGITLHFISKENGYLHVFNESVIKQSDSNKVDQEQNYNILFPTLNANNGETRVAADKEVIAVEGLFDEKEAIEKLWIVWTMQEDLVLKEIIKQAHHGEINSNGAKKLNYYLKTKQDLSVKAETDKQQLTRLSFDNEILVYSIEINYVGQ